MRCYVCGKEHDQEDDCPVCGFLSVEVLGDESHAETMRKLASQIDKCRDDLMQRLDIGVIAYHWKDDNGKLKMDKTERMSFGRGRELSKGAVWISGKFARIPKEERILIKISVLLDDEETVREVSIPNLMDAELQELGIELDKEMKLKVMLRNSTETKSSDRVYLFD